MSHGHYNRFFVFRNEDYAVRKPLHRRASDFLRSFIMFPPRETLRGFANPNQRDLDFRKEIVPQSRLLFVVPEGGLNRFDLCFDKHSNFHGF